MADDKSNWTAGMPLDPRYVYDLFVGGVIGTKEFRSWLAKIDPTFADVRDADVDNEIDRLARVRAENLRAVPEEDSLPIRTDE